MPSDDPIIIEPKSTPKPTGPDDPIILEPDSLEPPVTVQQVNVKWWKKWSTHLAGINFAAIVSFYAMLPDRMLDAIPVFVHGFIGVSLLASGLIPAATSIKQVRKVE